MQVGSSRKGCPQRRVQSGCPGLTFKPYTTQQQNATHIPPQPAQAQPKLSLWYVESFGQAMQLSHVDIKHGQAKEVSFLESSQSDLQGSG